jgi:hypothetical protein
MNFSEFSKRIYPNLSGISNQGHFVGALFNAAGSKFFPIQASYGTDDNQRKVFSGARSFNKKMKASFPKPIDTENLKAFFQTRIGDSSLPLIMGNFRIPQDEVQDKDLFISALCIQFQNIVTDAANEVKDIVASEYSRLLRESGIETVNRFPFYPGDNPHSISELPDQKFLKKSLIEIGFDGIFTEVEHTESLGLKNPHQLRMFYLNVETNAFSLDALYRFLRRNIGRYVYSRAKIEQFQAEGDTETIASQAISLLREVGHKDDRRIGGELGDMMLYIFLEQVLGAPKLYNRIELAQFGKHNIQNGGGVHLLPLENGGIPSYQMVFGKSNIIGNLQDAIDNAFKSLVTIRDNPSEELRIVESTIFAQAYDAQTTNYLRNLIVPGRQKNTPVDKAFGVFLGYSLGLNAGNYSNQAFRKEIMRKMSIDIKAHAAYIAKKIKEERLGTHSFYFYIVPFNDADGEKLSIMSELLGGGVG